MQCVLILCAAEATGRCMAVLCTFSHLLSLQNQHMMSSSVPHKLVFPVCICVLMSEDKLAHPTVTVVFLMFLHILYHRRLV